MEMPGIAVATLLERMTEGWCYTVQFQDFCDGRGISATCECTGDKSYDGHGDTPEEAAQDLLDKLAGKKGADA